MSDKKALHDVKGSSTSQGMFDGSPSGANNDNGASVKKVASGSAADGATTGATHLAGETGKEMMKQGLMANLQGLAAGAQNGAIGIVGAIKGGLTSAASAVTGAVSGIISAAASLGATSMAAIGAGAVAVIAATVVVATSIGGSMTAQRDDPGVNPCSEVESGISKKMEGVANVTALQEEYIKKTWSVISAMGGTYKQAAGILGCWMVESGIDPTSVETIFTEPYEFGEEKQKAEKVDYILADYDSSYKNKYPNIKRLGLGLGQWTDTEDGATRNTDLREYAKSVNKEWYDMDTQLGYMVGADGAYSDRLKTFIDTYQDRSVDDCVVWFLDNWEGVSGDKLALRQAAAGTIAVKLKSMEPDQAYGNSILAAAGAAAGSGHNKAKASAMEDCDGRTTGNYDNSSLAKAMVSFSYKTQAEGNGNNGTDLYQKLHKAIFPGDIYFMSCDRGVATAVRWSGSDDTFPVGPTATQYEYMKNSDKWKEVSEFGGGDWSKLLPGDVVITTGDGHICMYVGNAAIKEKYPDAPDSYDICSASYMERSPGCGVGQYEFGGRSITAFRCVKPDKSTTYANLP